MSTFNLNILNRIKTVEQKISLLENENKKLRVFVEAVSTATTTPLSAGKREYTGTNVAAIGGFSTTTGGGQNPQLPTGPDYNGDGVVDGADLGIFNSYYGQPGFDGAALGALLTAMGQPTSGGFKRKSGTTTKDIASLIGQRYISHI